MSFKDAYRDIVDENSLVFSLKDKESNIQGQYAASYYEVEEIKESYPDYIIDVGVTYYANFEKFFPDVNNLAISKSGNYAVVPGFSARHINDFTWLEEAPNEMYPMKIDYLEEDEIVLGMNYECIRELCFELQIERSVKSLSDYLKNNELYLYFDFANDDWTYSDQQIVRLLAFTLENELKIYHCDHLWNEYIFEDRMRFPSSDALSIKDNVPWMMKKIYYLKTNENRDSCLNLLYKDKTTDNISH